MDDYDTDKYALFTITGQEIRQLADLAGFVIEEHDYDDELETEITIVEGKARVLCDDGVVRDYDRIAYFLDYPVEGCFPIGEGLTEKKMSDDYLTGPALHRAIADAQEAGEGPEVFERYSLGRWVKANNWPYVIAADSEGDKIRRKPRMRYLIDMHGQRWEWPEPIREIVPNDRYFVSLEIPRKNGIRHFGDLPTQIEINLVREGRCFSTRESRDQAERALIAASGGSCD